jgi:antitoxin CptB
MRSYLTAGRAGKAARLFAGDIARGNPYIANHRPALVRVFAVGIKMTGSRISSEGLDERRRRLLFRSWHRGIRETDLIMGGFADAHIATLTDGELDAYEALIDVPDADLLGWVTGEFAVPAQYDTPLFRRMRDFHFRIDKT